MPTVCQIGRISVLAVMKKETRWISLAVVVGVLLTSSTIFGAYIPKPVKNRFVVGETVWRELPIRENLKDNYQKCWQLAINTILENGFDIATMEKASGYIRTTWNTGVIELGGKWAYKVQVSLKMVFSEDENQSLGDPQRPSVTKVRLRVAGELAKVSTRGVTIKYYSGYDKVILDNLFQDLQSKFGNI